MISYAYTLYSTCNNDQQLTSTMSFFTLFKLVLIFNLALACQPRPLELKAYIQF